jgi:hypothetical protein
MDSFTLTQKLKSTNQAEDETLDGQDDDGRIVFETEQANKILPWNDDDGDN